MAEMVIEKVFEERKTGVIILSLTQPDPWEAPNAMQRLRCRLNEYIFAIRDGLLFQKFPEYEGKPFKISVVCVHAPSEEVRLELDQVNRTLTELGIGFEIMQIEVTDPRKGGDPIKRWITSLVRGLRGYRK